MNDNWYASIKGQIFDESDFHIISHDEYMKIPIVKINEKICKEIPLK